MSLVKSQKHLESGSRNPFPSFFFFTIKSSASKKLSCQSQNLVKFGDGQVANATIGFCIVTAVIVHTNKGLRVQNTYLLMNMHLLRKIKLFIPTKMRKAENLNQHYTHISVKFKFRFSTHSQVITSKPSIRKNIKRGYCYSSKLGPNGFIKVSISFMLCLVLRWYQGKGKNY